MKTLVIILTAMSFIFIVCATSFAAADFRCGNTFAEPGKTQSAEIFISCGEPKLKEDLGYKGRGVGRKLEKWVYERGGVHYVLYFEGGLLVKIEIP